MSNPLNGKVALVAAASRGNLIEKKWLMSENFQASRR